jgi:pentatricopeptide repeat protein
MIQASRHFGNGMKRVVLADVVSRSIHTKVDLLRMIGLALLEQPPQAQAQGSPKISESKFVSNPMDFLNVLEKAGMKPDKNAYSQLLNHYSAQGDVESAISVFRKLKEQEVPDDRTYHTLITACINGKDQKSATKILKEMKKEGITPGVESYNVVLGGYVDDGNVSGAMKIFNKMKKANIRTYNLLMAICFNGKQPEKAMAYFNEIEKVGLTPDIDSYNTVLSRGSSSQMVDLSGVLGARIAPKE